MIVFLNTTNKTITVCDKMVKVYPWSKIKELTAVLSNKEILYVTEAVTAMGDDVLDLISSSYNEEDIGDQTHPLDTELYIRCTKGKLIAVYNGKEYVFGSNDFKPLFSLPDGITEKCRVVVDALKSGLLCIVDENEKEFLLQQKEEENEAAEERRSRQDEVVRGSVDDPIPIDLTSAGNFKRGKK